MFSRISYTLHASELEETQSLPDRFLVFGFWGFFDLGLLHLQDIFADVVLFVSLMDCNSGLRPVRAGNKAPVVFYHLLINVGSSSCGEVGQ